MTLDRNKENQNSDQTLVAKGRRREQNFDDGFQDDIDIIDETGSIGELEDV